MGMGLSISRSIIQAHGGQLGATPNPTHGTTFHFSLPAMAMNTAVVKTVPGANSEHAHAEFLGELW